MTKRDMYKRLDPSGDDPRVVSEVVNNLVNGKSNNTGTITLSTGGATTTTISNERIGYNSIILLVPLSANAVAQSIPFGSFQNTASQTAAAINTPYSIVLNTTDVANGMSLASNKITVQNAGIYNIEFSFQFVNTDTSIQNTYIWLAKNGTDITGTASKWAVVSSHGGVDGYALGAANFFVSLAANDYIEVKWSTDSVNLYLEGYTSSTSPFTRPSIPSSVVTLSYASSVATNGLYISSRTKGSATITHFANSVSDKTYGYIIVG